MASKTLFQSQYGSIVPPADARNEASGLAYGLPPKQALAQYASTGCLNQTFYASDADQLAKVLMLCETMDSLFIAKLAIHARQHAFMKDMPALLCAVLATRDGELLERVFDRVIDNGKMLRNFVQILRSGVTGRKSLGSRPKRLVRAWLEGRSSDQLFRASLGRSPSLADVVKMVHPKPSSDEKRAFYGYLLGREHSTDLLPVTVRRFEAYKSGQSKGLPDVPFQFLTALSLGRAEWTQIARQAPWQMTRMNLNTFNRHGVFDDQKMVTLVAKRLRDRKLIAQSKVFPYQIMTAYMNQVGLPREICDALHTALEISTMNIQKLPGKVYICLDVSGSMHSSVSGYRQGSTSKVSCVDVASLIAASIVRKNPSAEVIAFHDAATAVRLEPRDTIMTNARMLRRLPSGGTRCSAPLALLNQRQARGDLVIYVSDNESWIDTSDARAWNNGTAVMREWVKFKLRNVDARMVCIDIQPYGTTQAPDRQDILNIGGFSDQVFKAIRGFARNDAQSWVDQIEKIAI